MTKIMLRKELGALRPATDEAYRVLGSIGNGTTVLADVRDMRRRSNQQHSYWFAIITKVWENHEAIQKQCGDFETFRAMLLIELGYKKMVPKRDGTMREFAESVSFACMSQDKFTRLVDDTLTFMEGLGFDRVALEAEAKELSR